MGNLKANALYNPDERRHPPPTDSDESDRGSEMEIFIRSKYQHKRFMAPKEGASNAPIPASKSSIDDIQMPGIIEMRAPSRAKSTPITSSSSGAHSTNALSSYRQDPVPVEPVSSKVPVFSSGLPFRPATAAGLNHPSMSSASRVQETSYMHAASQPTPSSSSYASANPAPSAHNPYPMAPRMQPSAGANPLWDDMMSLTLQPSASAAQASYSSSQPQPQTSSGLYGGTMNLPSITSSSVAHASGPRSFSLPVTSMGSSSIAPNPFSQLGMAGNQSNSYVPQQQQQTNTPNPFGTMSASGSMGTAFQQQYGGGGQPQQQQFGGIIHGAQTTLSPTMLTPQSTSSSSLSAFQQAYRLTPSPSPFSAPQQPQQQSFQQNPSSFQSSPSPFQQQQQPGMNMNVGLGSFQQTGAFQQQQQPQQSFSPAQQGQSAFAQSMLPAHMKGSGAGQAQGGGTTNPFGNSWGQQQQPQNQNGYGYGGGAWGGR